LPVGLTVGLLSVLLIQPAQAQESRDETVVWQTNITVPVLGTTMLGTLTTTFDEASGQGAWRFQGTIDGQFATASGAGSYEAGDSTMVIKMTSIDDWRMPGVAPPAMPATASVREVGTLAYASFGPAVGVPVAVNPSLDGPLTSGAFILTTPGSGARNVTELPATGVAPTTYQDQSAPSLLLTTIGVLGLAALVWVARRGRAPRSTA
jgi:hypothetical protein